MIAAGLYQNLPGLGLRNNRDLTVRRTDPEANSRNYFRTQNRLFALNGLWFFTTREGEVGPFKSRETALKEVSRFVQDKRDLARFQKNREIQMRNGGDLALAIIPKDDEPDLTLDDLILENQR